MTDKRGNQTGYDLELPESGELSSMGDLYNPGHPDSGKEPRDPKGPVGFNQGQDISRAAKVTLGKYLSNSTKGNVGQTRPNAFQVPPDSAEAASGVDPSLTSRRPALARGDIETNGVTMGTYLDHAKGFTDTVRAARRFESTKDSEYGRDSTNPFVGPDVGVKSYSDPEARRRGQDGNSILLNVEPRGDYGHPDLGNPHIGPLDEGAPIVQRKISEVLKQNRFNPIEKAFVQNHTLSGPGTTLQRTMGSYVKDGAPEINLELLKEVGLKLMVRSTGHSVPGLDLLDSENSLKQLNNTAPLLPSAPQLTGLPLIDTVNLRAGNVAITPGSSSRGVGVTPESARTEYINEASTSYEGGPEEPSSTFSGQSYGVLNSHIEPFSGGLPIGTFTTTVAGIILLIGASAFVAALPLIFGAKARVPLDRQAIQNVSPAKLEMGRRAMIDSNEGNITIESENKFARFITEMLGIPRTDHNWGNCLLVGIASFFGLEYKPAPGGGVSIDTSTIAEKIFFLATAPGYYAVVIRNAIRDTEQIVRSIEEFAEAAADVNIIRSISGIFKIIESITTSALYRFMMSMTALGNQVLNAATYGGSVTQRIGRNSHNAGGFENNDLGSQKIGALKWKHSSAKSAYILPTAFSNSSDISRRIGYTNEQKESLIKSSNDIWHQPDAERGKRISPDVVKRIEDALGFAEYVPFYFHDLRTNEIISFHAFLADLSDGFTASYTSTTGYGRGDEVLIYNNTKRSISFSFHVVATSIEDLDVMYWNINKLITMLYPQYSSGRQMITNDAKFVQPFSQIQTASPMIRLRIGDIITGNYSRFGLARLFGLGTDRLTPPGIDAARRAASAARTTEIANRIAGWKTQRKNLPSPERYRVNDIVKLPSFNDTRDLRNSTFRRNDGATMSTRRTIESTNRFSPGLIDVEETRSDVPEGLRRILVGVGLLSTPADLKVKIVSLSTQANFPTPPESGYGLTTKWGPGVSIEPSAREIVALVEIQSIGFAWNNASHPELRSLAAVSDATGAAAGLEVLGSYRYLYVDVDRITDFDDEYVKSQVEDPGETEVDEIELYRNFFGSGETQNPIVRSFESARGRGLAGFITDLKMDWADSTWELDRGRQAPKVMKLDVSFSPIHDIPMGLDSEGMMRSVAYNVGDMSNVVGSDAYDDRRTVASPPGNFRSSS